MAFITLQVLDGADRGRVYENLITPVTIGREEGNTIQLNDERVSRFHLKIQEDQGRLVLTDLQSTNGTKVNGEDMQLRILRFGDRVTIGRSELLFGSRDQIAQRLAQLRRQEDNGYRENARLQDGADPRKTLGAEESSEEAPVEAASFEYEILTDDPELQAKLAELEPPGLPDRLSPGQAAQLADLLNYLHSRLRQLIDSVRMPKDSEEVHLRQRHWQNLLDLQMRLATCLRQIGEPGTWDDPNSQPQDSPSPSDQLD